MTEQQQRIDSMIGTMKARADEHGLSVRCPECGVGVGRWCRVNVRDQDSPVVKHEARVLAARS